MIADFRSDTLTQPTAEMREAMFAAKVGDDVFGEDPTINALEAKAAKMFGVESALFCPTGTMCNQIAIKALSSPPGQVIVEQTSHTHLYEGGGMAFHAGLTSTLIQGDRGRLTANQVAAALNPLGDLHQPQGQIVSVENTHNKGGGSLYAFSDLVEIGAFCKENGLKFHLDGARLWNALVETAETPQQYGALFDTISVCLSKGLGCPVGSLLLGSQEIVAKARRLRKLFGGGMRQAGFLAAAGIYALDNHIDRLTHDHQKARVLATELEGLPFVSRILDPQTNIVIFELEPGIQPQIWLSKLNEKGVKAVSFGGQYIRFVLHLDIGDDEMDHTISVLHNF